MKRKSENDPAQYISRMPDCNAFRDDTSLMEDCYDSYAFYIPIESKEDVHYRISVCEKIGEQSEFIDDNDKRAWCILKTAEMAELFLSETEYLQLCAKIPKLAANGYRRRDCFGERKDDFDDPSTTVFKDSSEDHTEKVVEIMPADQKGNTAADCVDSDGGQEFFVKGFIRGVDRCLDGAGEAVDCPNRGEMSHSDLCVQGKYDIQRYGNKPQLVEYYCGTDGRISGQSYLCPNGCSDGACRK